MLLVDMTCFSIEVTLSCGMLQAPNESLGVTTLIQFNPTNSIITTEEIYEGCRRSHKYNTALRSLQFLR
jgi:hypothetical protein